MTSGLHLARQQLHAVEVIRDDEFDDIEGFVVDIGSQWMLLAVLDPMIVLDGFAALRIQDIREVEVKTSSDFVGQALELRGLWPPPEPQSRIALADVRELLASAQGVATTVTLHLERTDPDCCYIGVLREIGTNHAALLEVTTSAEWEEEPTRYELDEITRVDIGGKYEEALIAVAGLPPTDDRPLGG